MTSFESDEALARRLQEEYGNFDDGYDDGYYDEPSNDDNYESDEYNPNTLKTKSKSKSKAKTKAKTKNTKKKNNKTTKTSKKSNNNSKNNSKNKNNSKSSKTDSNDTNNNNNNDDNNSNSNDPTNKENSSLNATNNTNTTNTVKNTTKSLKTGKKRNREEAELDGENNENSVEIDNIDGPPEKKKRKISKNNSKKGGKRQWSEEDEKLFAEGLEKHGRNWKEVIKYMGTDRNEASIRSHAQVYFVKLLKNRQELPAKVKESGDGYTLSGKPLNKYGAITLKVFAKPEDVPMDMGGVESDQEAANKLKRRNNNGDKNSDKNSEKNSGGRKSVRKAKKNEKSDQSSPAKKGKKGRKNNDDSSDDEYNPGFAKECDGIMANALSGNLRRSRRERKNTRKLNANPMDEDEYQLRSDIELYSPFGQIKKCNPQPFQIVWCPNALLIADLHSHLCRNVEIMGILGGYYDYINRKVYILKCYPLREEVQRPKTVTADTMDMHYISEYINNNEKCVINGNTHNMRILGWYHSHPEFENYPSNTDLEQHNAQKQTCHEEESPYIGLILSSWSSTGYATEYMWFNTIKEENQEYLPMQFNTVKQKFVDVNDPGLLKQIRDLIERYSEDRYKQYRSDLGTIWKSIYEEERDISKEEEDIDIEIDCNDKKSGGDGDLAVTTVKKVEKTDENTDAQTDEKTEKNQDDSSKTAEVTVRQIEVKVKRFNKILESLRANLEASMNIDNNSNDNNNNNNNSNDNSNGSVNDVNMIDNFIDYVKGVFYENFDFWWKRSDKPNENEVNTIINKNKNNKEWIAKQSKQIIINQVSNADNNNKSNDKGNNSNAKSKDSNNEEESDIDVNMEKTEKNKENNVKIDKNSGNEEDTDSKMSENANSNNNDNSSSVDSVDSSVINDTANNVNKMTLEQESIKMNANLDCKDVE